MSDADSTLEMLQDFLSGPDAKEKISEALSMLGGADLSELSAPKKKKDDTDAVPFDLDTGKIMKMMTLFKRLEGEADPRSDLLKALKPYLSADKQERTDRAIKMVKILKFAPMLEGLRDLF